MSNDAFIIILYIFRNFLGFLHLFLFLLKLRPSLLFAVLTFFCFIFKELSLHFHIIIIHLYLPIRRPSEQRKTLYIIVLKRSTCPSVVEEVLDVFLN